MCSPEPPLFHQSCVDLQEEICITHYRPHCVLHFERDSSDESKELKCDFCRQKHRSFKYRCGDCDFQIGVGCASMLIKYHQGQQHVEHCSHRHPLTLMKLHDIDMNCKLCSKSINGPGYGCAPCEFYIHNSCRDEFPQEIRHPFHPRHSLQLLDGEPNRYDCDACQFNIQGLRYRCDMCAFNLHLECSSLKPNVEYKGHQHLLILIEGMFDYSICEACGFGIEGVFSARCVRCDLDFHLQCGSDPLPPSVLHKDHEHPLILNKFGGSLHCCYVCGQKRNSEDPFYCCVECEYFAHVRCAITEIQYDDKGRSRHFSHEHILILREIPKNNDIFCHGCREAIQGPTYGCDPCKFYLHKSCVELPREIHHESHEHYLRLRLSDISKQITCHACGKLFNGFTYHCDTCYKFDLDIGCASEHPAVNLMVSTDKCESHEGQERIGHFSHEHHLDVIPESEVTNLNCEFCCKTIDGRCYGCVGCEFYIHISCSELPTEVRHPFHQLHPLTLLVAKKFRYRCDACRFGIHGFRYRCDTCDFDLHPDCLSLKANIKYKGHEHLLTLIENMDHYGECAACGLTTDGAFFMRCMECKLNFHVQCGPHQLPLTVMVIQHEHRLTLMTGTLAEDNSDQSYCTVCRKEINPEHPAYCCADCEYYAHVGCVITELQVDERQKTTKHFSHEHLLFLYENKWNDDIFCDGCGNDIQANEPAYGCDQCDYYLHKSCAELPRERQHPFHRHPLFLSDSPEECSACRKDIYSFCYLCEDCDFILDLDCSSLLPSIKLESVHHEHTLTFFKKLYGTPECESCKSYNIPPDELTPLDLSYIRCVKCNKNWHLLCFEMPQTIDHHSHLHSLALKDKCVELSSHCYDDKYYCDFCETIRDGRECVYHCENCNFVVDLECVFSEVMQFVEGKSKDVELRSVGKSRLTYSYKYIFENLSSEEKKTMESTRNGVFEELEKIQERTPVDIFKELEEIDDTISGKVRFYAKGLLKHVAKEHTQGLLQLGYIDREAEHKVREAELELVNVRDYKINPKLAPVLKKLLEKYDDIGASCPLTPKLKTIALITFCTIVEIMNNTEVKNLDVASLIMWWFLLKLVQRAGFKIDFALDQLKRIGLDFFQKNNNESSIRSSPFTRFKRS
ncbi:DC1 domain-containing protein [Citrus sinensis]|uniref:Phorbol-ester/DAG-type domain-containing protein n=3 Tax=Citrus TaxID=2706 RepID=A0A067EXR8_CITSI|nr:uncharacterized protein LOC102619482 [Citrus sinensis]XP_024036772.1 uncharacterized protein LOC18036656 [Citrus x clementina]KAH9669601.1 DC1 domain-containing protein [Citrus sinensis]KDO59888.1 hypothetical protein CISIN_1g001175mg [Citrus sinensis]